MNFFCRITAAFAALLMLFSLAACGKNKTDTVSSDIFLMDTITTIQLPDTEDADRLFSECEKLGREIENIFSATIATSEISRFNASENGIDLSDEALDVTTSALRLSELSDGCYDPTVRGLVTLWNITSGNERIPSDTEISNELKSVGFAHLTLNGNTLTKDMPSVALDLGGIAKGYACQRTVELLTNAGVPFGIVSYGGNIGLVGHKPNGEKWRIAVTDPFDPAESVGYLELDGGFIAVSGDYERYFEKDGVRYHHILDPKSGYPTDNGLHSVAVWSEDGTLADGLSTALFVMGEEKAMELYRSGELAFEAMFISDNGITMTDGMKDRFTMQNA